VLESAACTVDDALDLRLHIWVIDEWRGDPANRAPDEHDAVGWFQTNELASLRLADERYQPLLRQTMSRSPDG
jgi:8-oxo-dGTP diphosphatase